MKRVIFAVAKDMKIFGLHGRLLLENGFGPSVAVIVVGVSLQLCHGYLTAVGLQGDGNHFVSNRRVGEAATKQQQYHIFWYNVLTQSSERCN